MGEQDQEGAELVDVDHHSTGAFSSLSRSQAFLPTRHDARDMSSVAWSSCHEQVCLP